MTSSTSPLRRALGLPPLVILGLGLLAAVRGVVHDATALEHLPAVNLPLVFVPLLVWLVVAVRWATRPFVALVASGAVYGVALAITHLALWDVTLGGTTPTLGGALDGVLPPLAEAILLRAAAATSSLMVGLGVGALTGDIAWVIRRGTDRRRTVASEV